MPLSSTCDGACGKAASNLGLGGVLLASRDLAAIWQKSDKTKFQIPVHAKGLPHSSHSIAHAVCDVHLCKQLFCSCFEINFINSANWRGSFYCSKFLTTTNNFLEKSIRYGNIKHAACKSIISF